jgi:hypothetical protein
MKNDYLTDAIIIEISKPSTGTAAPKPAQISDLSYSIISDGY